jgi:hypothetical protein
MLLVFFQKNKIILMQFLETSLEIEPKNDGPLNYSKNPMSWNLENKLKPSI